MKTRVINRNLSRWQWLGHRLRRHHPVWVRYWHHSNGVRLKITTCSCGDEKVRRA